MIVSAFPSHLSRSRKRLRYKQLTLPSILSFSLHLCVYTFPFLLNTKTWPTHLSPSRRPVATLIRTQRSLHLPLLEDQICSSWNQIQAKSLGGQDPLSILLPRLFLAYTRTPVMIVGGPQLGLVPKHPDYSQEMTASLRLLLFQHRFHLQLVLASKAIHRLFYASPCSSSAVWLMELSLPICTMISAWRQSRLIILIDIHGVI